MLREKTSPWLFPLPCSVLRPPNHPAFLLVAAAASLSRPIQPCYKQMQKAGIKEEANKALTLSAKEKNPAAK